MQYALLAGIMLFVGPALGPTVGGALIGAVGWRGIFLVNIPAGALAAVAVRFVPVALAPGRQPGARFDLTGLVLLAAGLSLARRRGPVLAMALAPRLLTRLTVRVTVLAGFAILASLGLLLIGAETPLWLIAVILACRSVSVGLVINPLLQALLQPLAASQLGDASTLFNTWQRVAGSFGIGLIAALYATQTRDHGPVAALHAAGLVLAGIALAAALAAAALPAVRNTALSRR